MVGSDAGVGKEESENAESQAREVSKHSSSEGNG